MKKVPWNSFEWKFTVYEIFNYLDKDFQFPQFCRARGNRYKPNKEFVQMQWQILISQLAVTSQIYYCMAILGRNKHKRKSFWVDFEIFFWAHVKHRWMNLAMSIGSVSPSVSVTLSICLSIFLFCLTTHLLAFYPNQDLIASRLAWSCWRFHRRDNVWFDSFISHYVNESRVKRTATRLWFLRFLD